jgi:hypothetical protein
MKPQESACPAATSSPADTPGSDLEQKVAPNRARNLALINSDKTPRLVPPPSGFKESVKKRLDDIQKHTPKLYPLFFKVYADQTPLSKAVKAKCLDCSCWQPDEITNCTVFTCPLWNFRPYQKP